MKPVDLSAIPLTGIAIVVDGGCTNNQLPANARTMYGSFAVFLNGKRIERVTHYDKVHDHQYRWEADMPMWRETTPDCPPTNNVAECEMMVQALAYAERVTANPKNAGKTINIAFLGDSQVVEAYTKAGSKVGKDAKHLTLHHDAINARFQTHSNFSFTHMNEQTVKGILGH